ncbi:MAG: hypothetical protein AB8G11_12780 [Saprospiraceae bacterium]
MGNLMTIQKFFKYANTEQNDLEDVIITDCFDYKTERNGEEGITVRFYIRGYFIHNGERVKGNESISLRDNGAFGFMTYDRKTYLDMKEYVKERAVDSKKIDNTQLYLYKGGLYEFDVVNVNSKPWYRIYYSIN